MAKQGKQMLIFTRENNRKKKQKRISKDYWKEILQKEEKCHEAVSTNTQQCAKTTPTTPLACGWKTVIFWEQGKKGLQPTSLVLLAEGESCKTH